MSLVEMEAVKEPVRGEVEGEYTTVTVHGFGDVRLQF